MKYRRKRRLRRYNPWTAEGWIDDDEKDEWEGHGEAPLELSGPEQESRDRLSQELENLSQALKPLTTDEAMQRIQKLVDGLGPYEEPEEYAIPPLRPGLQHFVRRFSREELDEIINYAIKLQSDILGGRITISDAIGKISGDVYIDEKDITVKAESEAFDRYMDWVSKTWDADKVVTKYVLAMLGMPEKGGRPTIVPTGTQDWSGRPEYVFRCETCPDGLLTKGGVVMDNNLRCSVQCLGWWEKEAD